MTPRHAGSSGEDEQLSRDELQAKADDFDAAQREIDARAAANTHPALRDYEQRRDGK